jgi:hypothetical protein
MMLIDVVGKKVAPFCELHPYLVRATRREVRFGFVPDKMKVVATDRLTLPGNNTHLLPPFRWTTDE